MRSTIVAAAFAMGALAVPYKRDVVTDIDIVYATEYVTVYAGDQPTSTPEPAPEPTTQATTQQNNWWGNHHGNHHQHSHKTSSSVEAPPAYSAPAPETTTYVEPEPTSTYVAPTTSAEPNNAAVEPPAYSAPADSAPADSAPAYSAPASSSEAPATSAAPASKPTDYAGKAVYHHNLHRANHSSPDIEWDDQLASTAAKIAQSCSYAHDTLTDADQYPDGYGQNIAAGVESKNISLVITDLFYNGEVGYYDGLYGEESPDMSNFEKWGHFSQIVWKGTTKVGCATQDCTSTGLKNVGKTIPPYFTVCNYANPGNYAGEYKPNVLEPLGKPTCYWDEGL